MQLDAVGLRRVSKSCGLRHSTYMYSNYSNVIGLFITCGKFIAALKELRDDFYSGALGCYLGSAFSSKFALRIFGFDSV